MSNNKFSLHREMQKLIRILFQASKWMFPIMILQNMVLSLLPFLNIWYGYRILDEMLSGSSKDAVMALVWQMVLWNLGLGVLAKCLERCRIVLRERVYLKVDETIIDKTLAMDYEMMESKYRANLLRTVQEGQSAGNDICTFCDKLCGVIQDMFSLVYAVTLLHTIFTSHPVAGELSGITAFCSSSVAPAVLLLLYLLVILGEAAVVMKQNRLYDEAYQDNLSSNRKMEYFYELIFYEYKNGKDFRLYRMEKLLLTYLRQFFDGIRERTSRFLSDSSKLDACTLAAEGTLLFLAYLFVGVRALSGSISVAEVLKYVSTLTLFSQACKSLMNRYGELERILFSLQNYSRYLELGNEQAKGILSVDTVKRAEEEGGLGEGKQDGARKAFRGLTLEFKDVSFSYPDSSEKILNHFSLKLDLQGKLALVGKNGAGKSTFIKLLCRLYDPTEGQILLKGIDISRYNYDEYVRLFSVVFQDYFTFDFSLGENVSARQDYDADKVWSCLKKVGIDEKFAQMERGLETPLGTGYQNDGVEISGGEEQKVVLARALYKDAPYIILDEPTAALDPIAEAEVYSKFNEIVGDKTAIYISHRLSSCRLADKILVFHEGEIIQQGSHDQLVADTAGKYHELWNAQAQYYT